MRIGARSREARRRSLSGETLQELAPPADTASLQAAATVVLDSIPEGGTPVNWHEIPRSLQLRYLHAAAITVAQLGRLLAEVERGAGAGGRQALKLMLRRFYGLAAWAALHGLAAVSVAAQRGEHDCSTLAASQVVPQPAHLDQIRAQVDALRHEIYRLRTTGGICDEILWAMPLPESARAGVASGRRQLI
jgi:hypothetical protein